MSEVSIRYATLNPLEKSFSGLFTYTSICKSLFYLPGVSVDGQGCAIESGEMYLCFHLFSKSYVSVIAVFT